MTRNRRHLLGVLLLTGMARAALAAPPVAGFSPNVTSGNVPLAVFFDASASSDPDGDPITRYDWDFGDGQTSLGNTSTTTLHTYTAVGTYTAALTVTAGGEQNITTRSIVVFQVTPVVATLGTASTNQDADVSLDLTFTPSPDMDCSGFQFDLSLPASVSYLSAVAGPAATAAGKQVHESASIPRVILIGFNQTALGAGVAVTVNLHIAANAPTGVVPIALTNLVATNPAGIGIPITGVNGSLTVSLVPPVITSPATASGVVNTVFPVYQITTAQGATSFGATGLPPGLSVNTTNGRITGTPTQVGTFNATISATNAAGTGSASLTIAILTAPPPAPVITSALTASGAVGTALTPYQIAATNSPTSYGASGLPAGLSVSAVNGRITGTPTQPGTFNTTISATNLGGTGQAILVFTISGAAGGALPAPILNLPAEIPVNAQISVSYPAGYSIRQYTWSLVQQTSAGSPASPARAARAGATNALFTTPSSIADLGPQNLIPGVYQISVSASDGSGNTSPTATQTVTLVAANLNAVKVYPNPWRADRHGRQVTFAELTNDTQVDIFTVSGHRVRSLSGSANIPWDLANDSGEPVASGLYIYLVSDNQGNKIRGKLALIH